MSVVPNSESDAEKLRQRNRELSILNTIAEALNRSVDIDQALTAALAQVADLLGLHTGWIWLLDETSSEPYLAASQDLPPGLRDHPHRMEGSCYCLDTYEAGDLEGAANINVVTCSRLRSLVDGTDGLRYHASIPLYTHPATKAHQKRLGVLNVASGDWRELTSDDLRLLHTIGDLLSISIERARLYVHSIEFGAIEERNRLAREIHDTLAQGLTGIALQLETADAMLESGAGLEQVKRVIRQALEQSRTNLEEARRSVLDLRAAPLEGRTLAEALEEHISELPRTKDLTIQFSASGANHPLPARIETGLYRIAQETITNALEHANASQVVVDLVTNPEGVTLTVRDDGQGFDPDHIPPGRYGLLGLNERTRLLGGKLRIHSERGAGTKVEVRVPL
jgi:two-component system, NarL family, sensor kinase